MHPEQVREILKEQNDDLKAIADSLNAVFNGLTGHGGNKAEHLFSQIRKTTSVISDRANEREKRIYAMEG
jgi:ElaB/YqjD/DUF883 family membrane-anchored ribosome-binding protein